MGFGNGISSLLQTYSNCLALLKVFNRDSRDGSVRSKDRQSLLHKSLKSNRTLVERAYSSRLSESGSRFEEGDARAISAVERILKKLSAAVRNLLRISSKNQRPVLDYDSLLSLSNGSRVEAIRAIDGLSRRLGSSSPASVVSSSSKTSSNSSSTRSKSSRHKRHRPSTSSTTLTRANDGPLPDKASKKPPVEKEKEKHKSRSKPTRSPDPPTPSSPRPSRRSHVRPASVEVCDEKPEARRRSARSPKVDGASPTAAASCRMSIMTIASDSTRLGEVPERKWRPRHTTDSCDSDEFNVTPVYPLKPYKPPVKEKRGLWGLFGRKKERSSSTAWED
ncbi:hypothetical protein QBC46DRAFT_336861 [Diplogelasinospora grovesii]|uniref:Uncharacterized protein n=1 Tax=Diplogelasinospora grovesii TaxID=303347 RepID=A0AAN6NH30_9PEZI|nr:hypothetical protein QBC46DRAFT_336861 [Diplogelasinospora grovesii]